MRMTVVGCNGAVPRAGGACSGYLVRHEQTSLLLDCGTGVYARLREVIDPFALDAVVVSHLHADHFFDLVPFRYALRYALAGAPSPPPALWLPPGGRQFLAGFAAALGGEDGFFEHCFDVREFALDQEIGIGGLTLRFGAVRHYIPSYGLRVRGGGTLVYSGDSAWCREVIDLAAGADLFLCEATAQESTKEQTSAGHLSAGEAGRVAAAAGARRLLLTHIWHELEPAVSGREARATFGGPVAVAVEGQEYEIGG